jgi:hypothetical protein
MTQMQNAKHKLQHKNWEMITIFFHQLLFFNGAELFYFRRLNSNIRFIDREAGPN